MKKRITLGVVTLMTVLPLVFGFSAQASTAQVSFTGNFVYTELSPGPKQIFGPTDQYKITGQVSGDGVREIHLYFYDTFYGLTQYPFGLPALTSIPYRTAVATCTGCGPTSTSATFEYAASIPPGYYGVVAYAIDSNGYSDPGLLQTFTASVI